MSPFCQMSSHVGHLVQVLTKENRDRELFPEADSMFNSDEHFRIQSMEDTCILIYLYLPSTREDNEEVRSWNLK